MVDVFVTFCPKYEDGNKTRDYYIAKGLLDKLDMLGISTYAPAFEDNQEDKKDEILTKLKDCRMFVLISGNYKTASVGLMREECDTYYEEILKDSSKIMVGLIEGDNIDDYPNSVNGNDFFDDINELVDYIQGELL